MNDRDWFIEQGFGAFPDGAWFYQLESKPGTICDDVKAIKRINIFARAIHDYLDNPLRRVRPRVLTRIAKHSRDGQICYTYYVICSRRHEASRMEIARAWEQWTGGNARSELLHTRADADRRIMSIAKYSLEGGTEDDGIHHDHQ